MTKPEEPTNFTNRREKRRSKHSIKHIGARSPLFNLMIMQNERIQAMFVGATQSTYVPVPKGDGRPLAMLRRIEREQRRNAAWTGARA